MSTPYASTNTFSIADDKFYAYRAQDSHGSRCDVYMVNGQVVSHMAFLKACIAALGDGAFVLHSLFCLELSLTPSKVLLPIGRTDFTVNGSTYGLTVGDQRPTWREMTVNGHQVGFEDFARAVVDGCRSTARVIRGALYGLNNACSKRAA
jgi:hypothetical protein